MENKKLYGRRTLSLFLSIVLVFSVFSVLSVTASAATGFSVAAAFNLSEGVNYTKSWDRSNYSKECYNKITIPSDGMITFTMTKPIDSEGEYGDVDIYCYDENGAKLEHFDSSEGNKVISYYEYRICVPAGTYYLNIDPSFIVSSGAPSTTYYYTFEAGNYYEKEPNGGIPTANPISLDKEYTGVIGGYDDAGDYYSFNVVAGSYYAIVSDDLRQIEEDETLLVKFITPDGDEEYTSWEYNASLGSYYVMEKAETTGTAFWKVYNYSGKLYDYKFKVIKTHPCIGGHTERTEYGDEPTCTEPGVTDMIYCSVCDEVLQPHKTIPATGHIYEDGYCMECWEDAPMLKLKSVSNTTSGVKVTWSKLSGAKKYLVYRKTTGGWTRLDTVTGTSFTDETAKSGTTYKYTVKAQIGNSYSDYNTSGLSIKYLAAPKISSVENKNTGISVKWNKVSGAKGYIVYRKAAGASSWTNLGTTTSTSFADKTAKNNVKYTYTVKAYNGSTKSAHYSSGKSLVRLVTPKLTKVTATTGKNTFTFGKVTGATTYVVYRKTGSGSWKKIATTKSTSYVDKSVKKGTYYTYTVRAYKSGSYSYYNTTGLKTRAK